MQRTRKWPFRVTFWMGMLGLWAILAYVVDRVLDGKVHWWGHYVISGAFWASIWTWAIVRKGIPRDSADGSIR